MFPLAHTVKSQVRAILHKSGHPTLRALNAHLQQPARLPRPRG